MKTISNSNEGVNYFPRPRGRSPLGKCWNTSNGQWETIKTYKEPVDCINNSTSNAYLNKYKLSELKKKSIECGMPINRLNQIDDKDNPRIYFEEYLLKVHIFIIDNILLYEGVEYLFDSKTNEICDSNTFDLIGTLRNSNILWHNNKMQEKHTENKNNINNI